MEPADSVVQSSVHVYLILLYTKNTYSFKNIMARAHAAYNLYMPARRQCYRRRQTTTDASEQTPCKQYWIANTCYIIYIRKLTLFTEFRNLYVAEWLSWLPARCRRRHQRVKKRRFDADARSSDAVACTTPWDLVRASILDVRLASSTNKIQQEPPHCVKPTKSVARWRCTPRSTEWKTSTELKASDSPH